MAAKGDRDAAVEQGGLTEETNDKDTSTTTFRLLDLPPELQLRIFEFAVVSHKPIQVTAACGLFSEKDPAANFATYDGALQGKLHFERDWRTAGYKELMHPSLAQTCTAIRADALNLFYTKNSFIAPFCCYHLELLAWIKRIGTQNCQKMNRFYLSDKEIAGPEENDRVRGDLEYFAESEMCTVHGGRILDSEREDITYCRVIFGTKGTVTE